MTPWHRPGARAVAAVCLALASVSTPGASTYCDAIGESAPEVVTLMASKKNPETEAWVVSPDCKVKTISRTREQDTFYLNSLGIERVVSVPTFTSYIFLQGNPLTRGADLSMVKQRTTVALSAVPTDPRSLQFPAALTGVNIVGTAFTEPTSLDGIQFPTNLGGLIISGSGVKSLKNVQIPNSITDLAIELSPLTALDFTIPPNVKSLGMYQLPLTTGSLERLSLPSKLEALFIQECGSLSIRGIKWPNSLRTVLFTGTKFTGFEIRESDFDTLSRVDLSSALYTGTTCSGAAKPRTVGSASLCVISDAEFERLYGASVVSPTPASPASPGTPGGSSSTRSPSKPKSSSGGSKTSKSGSGDGNTEESGGNEDASSLPSEDGSVAGGGASTSRGTKSPSAGSSFDLSSDATSSETGTKEGSQSTANNRTSSQKGSTKSPTKGTTESSKSGSSGTIVVIVLVSVAVVVAACGMIVKAKKPRTAQESDNLDGATAKLNDTDTFTASFNDYVSNAPPGKLVPPSSDLDMLGMDFRNDSDFVRSRIDQVTIGKRIARGGYGIVYRGSYQGRVVAIKQMLPDAWRSDSMVADFVDEIRLCTRLEHEKIVEFIGVSWTGVRDLSVVTEFMAGGDLHSVIRKYPESSGREWTRPWTSSNLRNKTLIAIDVAEAVVYLHSLSPAVIHRDLKSKNVLLDLVGNAKLSDFGISRTVTVDETMTSEVGTAAWIAPEVLRGERYSEKADIYSLGVLLVELDRCSHPYANEPVLLMGSLTPARGALSRANTSHVAHKNTQIAVLVSTGQLRPSTSEGCPEGIAALVTRCLSFDAGDRPTPIEVLYQLRQIQRSSEAAGDLK